MTTIVQQSLTGTLLEVSNRGELNLLPERARRGGHIYLIEFSDGTVKAGKTINPQSRMDQHYGESIRYGMHPKRIWVSPEHENFSSNEGAAMKFCGKSGRISGGREYFSGKGLFDDVKPMLENLEFTQGGKSNGMSTREWIQDMIEAEHARYELADLKEMLGDTPTILLHQLGLLHHGENSPQKFYDWVMNDESCNTYDGRLNMLDLYMKIADLHDIPANEFLAMDSFEKVESLIHRLVSSQVELLRAKAQQEGMYPLFDPIRDDIFDAAESVGL